MSLEQLNGHLFENEGELGLIVREHLCRQRRSDSFYMLGRLIGEGIRKEGDLWMYPFSQGEVFFIGDCNAMTLELPELEDKHLLREKPDDNLVVPCLTYGLGGLVYLDGGHKTNTDGHYLCFITGEGRIRKFLSFVTILDDWPLGLHEVVGFLTRDYGLIEEGETT